MKNVFRVTGSFRAKHHDQRFRKEIVAETPERAKELVLSLMGSKHHVPRRLVEITNVAPVKLDEVEDAVVRHQAEMK